MTTTSLCRALLVLNVGFCALAVSEDRLPGWHMFEDVERFDVTLRDREGAVLDIRTFLPRYAWLVRYEELTEVVRFVCEKERGRAPFTFEERVRGIRVDALGPDDCRIPRAAR